METQTPKALTQPPRLHCLLQIALPMILSQATETIMMFVDRIFLSIIGKEALSATMTGGLSVFVFSSFFSGLVGYVNAIVAQYNCANRLNRCIKATFQALWLSIFFYPLTLALIPFVNQSFHWAGHSLTQISLESTYFQILMFGTIIYMFRQALVGYFLGQGRTRIVLIANITGMLLNIPLNYILIFGKLGFFALGITGAAYGTLCGGFAVFTVLLIYFLKNKVFKEYSGTGRWKIRKDLMLRLIKFGWPAGMELFLTVFAFNIFI